MAGISQSTQTQSTTAPQFYTDYLSKIASEGQKAADAAQFADVQPLQTQAFDTASANVGKFQPTMTDATNLAKEAGGIDITGAAQPGLSQATSLDAVDAANPYLTSAANSGGLSAANPYLRMAATNNPGEMAASYMSPFAKVAAQGMSDIAQRNIMNNLAPGATAGAVGSGQFGSQRGAQVLGQVNAQANADLNAKIADMMNTGYGQALNAATAQQSLLGTLGNTAGTLQQQQASVLAQLGLTKGNLTNTQAQNLINAANTAQQAATNQANVKNQASVNLGNIGQTSQKMSLADIDALSTLGGQQQTIAQNKQNYPLTKLASLAALLQGQQVPSTVTTEMNMSPLSTLAALGTGAGGLFAGTGTNGTGPSLYEQMTGQKPSSILDYLKSLGGGSNTGAAGGGGSGGNDASITLPPDSTIAGTNANGVEVYYSPSTGKYTDQNGQPVDITGMEGE